MAKRTDRTRAGRTRARRNGKRASPRGGARNGAGGNGTGPRQRLKNDTGAIPTVHVGGYPSRGTLVIIGGGEDKEGDQVILKEVVRRLGGGKLVVATIATRHPQEVWRSYEKIFRKLGVKELEHLEVPMRRELVHDPRLEALDGAAGIFFTGGSQLRITTQFAGTPLCERLLEFYHRGGLIAGTSAGASVMCGTMLVSGNGDSSHKIGTALRLAPGLGFIQDAIIDQHFAERGRIGRLLGAVAQNPRLLGIGIDEDTAIVVEREDRFLVIGSGAVYVVDGRGVTFTNIVEEEDERTMSIFDVRLHVLSQGDEFDLRARHPSDAPAERVEKEILQNA